MSGTGIDPSLEAQVNALRVGLKQFNDAVQRRLVRNALNAGMRIVTRGIKEEIPSEWKALKPLVGQRLIKSAVGGQISGKMGFGVGKVTRARQEKTNRRMAAYKSGQKKGVGISSKNVHWFILGTKSRRTSAGKDTGIMPPQVPDAVKDGVRSSTSAARMKIVESLKAGIEKESSKVRDLVNHAK